MHSGDVLERAGTEVPHPARILVASSLVIAIVGPYATARAQPESETETETETPSPLSEPGVFVDGGVVGFIDSRLRNLVHDGQSWGAKLAMGSFDDVRIELTYMASIQGLDPTAGDSLVGHEAEAILRINVAPWLDALEPFFYFGAGWTRYHVRGRAPGSPLEPQDTLLSIPFGLGIGRRVGWFVFDVRGGIEAASGGDLLPIERETSSSARAASMERFMALAVAGITI
jgi:hypothetical protein